MTNLGTAAIRRSAAGDRALVVNVRASETTKVACSRATWTCLGLDAPRLHARMNAAPDERSVPERTIRNWCTGFGRGVGRLFRIARPQPSRYALCGRARTLERAPRAFSACQRSHLAWSVNQI